MFHVKHFCGQASACKKFSVFEKRGLTKRMGMIEHAISEIENLTLIQDVEFLSPVCVNFKSLPKTLDLEIRIKNSF